MTQMAFEVALGWCIMIMLFSSMFIELLYSFVMLLLFIAYKRNKEPFASIYAEKVRFDKEFQEQEHAYRYDIHLLRDIHKEKMLSIIRNRPTQEPEQK